MRKVFSPFLIVITILFLVSLSTCKNKKDQGTGEKAPGIQNSGRLVPGNPDQQKFLSRLDEINPGLKDPSGIISLLEMTGADFIPDLINNSGNDLKYLEDSSVAAVNLGVYTVDLVYLLAFKQDEKADMQLERARVLAERIGAGHLYDQGLYRRYRAAGVPADTLIRYLSRAAETFEHEYRELELLRLYTLFATGEFIEKLHLTTSLLVHADRDDLDHYWAIMILVFQQEKALDNLIQLLDQVRDYEEGERFMAMMKDLKLIYMELNSSNEMAGINTQNITENQTFKDLVNHLNMARNFIISPE